MLVDKAIVMASIAHSGQRRKYDDTPYIVHPLEVMTIVHHLGNATDAMLAAAVMHDTVEDTQTSLGDVQKHLGEEVMVLVMELTKVIVPGNRAARKLAERERLALVSDEAQTIKLADIISNTQRIAIDDPDFAAKYLREQELLIEVLRKGNGTLQFRAREIIEVNDKILAGGVCRI